jgi:signal recognition particle subunit SRP54
MLKSMQWGEGMFGNLTEKISCAFKRLRSKGRLCEDDIKVAMREIKMALLEADVNYLVVKDFIERVTARAVGSEILKSLTPAQMVVKIVNEELVSLLGGRTHELKVSGSPGVVLLCGLQGSGKTTQCVKLALFLRKKGYFPLIAACDIYRPAAIKQLEVLAKGVSIDVFSQEDEKPAKIAQNALQHAKDHDRNVLIIDTAGRLQIDEPLMRELQEIKSVVNPAEILLVVDSMIGQDSVNVAKTFDEKISISGVILTKFDGDARGGAAFSVKHVTGKPIKFVGTGEKVENFEQFFPERMASRILGMGDVLSLIENAQANFDSESAEKIAEKLKRNKFDFNDFLNMVIQMKKLGPLKSLIEKLPIGGLNNLDFDDRMVIRVEAIIFSMTPNERSNPEIINSSRRRRIALGSGNKVDQVNMFFKNFELTRKMFKNFGGIKGGGFVSKFLFKR